MRTGDDRNDNETNGNPHAKEGDQPSSIFTWESQYMVRDPHGGPYLIINGKIN